MENSIANQEQAPQRGAKTQITGVPYPNESLESVITVANLLVAEHGTGKPITKEEIAKAVNKSPNGLSLYFSTFVQYGIFQTVHGKGYAPTELYRKYMNPVHDGDEQRVMLEMFKKPILYAKIIENQNGHVLPTDSKRFGNMLKGDPFNVTEYAAERAARVFLENARFLGLLDGHNTFRLNGDNAAPVVKLSTDSKKNEFSSGEFGIQPGKLFELPIPLSGGRKAKLLYPLENLTRKDIRVIAKALAFIASTVLSEEDAFIAEKDIEKEVFDRDLD